MLSAAAPARAEKREATPARRDEASRPTLIQRDFDGHGALEGAGGHCACGGGCPRCEETPPFQAQLEVSSPGDPLELEADRIALRTLTRSGLDPRGVPRFFSTLLEEEQRQPQLVLQWFSTHPLTQERVAAADTLIATLPDEALEGLRTDLPGFGAVRNRLLALPPPPETVQ